MRHSHKRGDNYEVRLGDDAVAECRVFRRADLSRDQGARCADEKATILSELAGRPAQEVRALLFDLTDAPDVWGPTTQRALERMLTPWQRANKRVVIVVGPEPLQRFNVEALLKSTTPDVGRIASSRAEAEAMLAPKSTR